MLRSHDSRCWDYEIPEIRSSRRDLGYFEGATGSSAQGRWMAYSGTSCASLAITIFLNRKIGKQNDL